MFTVDTIILKKLKIQESKNIFYLFSKDFGKVSVWFSESKSKNPIDLGSIINCVIKVNKWINSCNNYKLKSVIDYSNLSHKSIENILDLLNYFWKLMPEWIPHPDIFDDYKYSLPYLEKNETNNKITALLKLKLLRKCWITIHLDEFKASNNLKKIFNAVINMKFESLLKIKWIEEDLINELNKYNNSSFERFILN